jgi:hypothetical protein
MGASSLDGEEECHMDAFDNCRVKQVRLSPDHRRCWDRAPDLGVWCRCVPAAAGWLQGVRRLLAAWFGLTCSS